ncbi:TonB-dependent receptor plug domain-containing protein [Shewanella gaetbuli]
MKKIITLTSLACVPFVQADQLQNDITAQIASQINEVMVITATAGQSTPISEAPASISMIDVDMADKVQMSQDLGDIIFNIPGISVSTNSNGSRSVNMRGLSNDYTQVLLNNQRSHSGEALWRGDDNVLSAVPSIAMSHVEVVRGPMSSIYGADAMGGVVNVFTKKHNGSAEGAISIEGQYNIGDEGGNGEQLGLYFSTPINDTLSWTVFGNYLHLDETFYEDVPTSSKLRARDNYNVFNQLDINLAENHQLGLELQLSREDQQANSVYNGRTLDQNRDKQAVRADYQFTMENGEFNANFFYDDFQVDYLDNPTANLHERTYGVDTQASFYFDQYDVTFGATAKQSSLTGNDIFFEGDSIERTASGIFAETNIALTDNTKLTLGGRLDDDEQFGSEFTYRAYLTHQIANGWSIKGGISTAFKAPKMVQTFADYTAIGCGGRCEIVGNEDLEAETGTFGELGVHYDNNNTRASVTLFNSDIENIIEYVAVNESLQTFGNIDNATIKGVEATVSHQFEHVGIEASYTYLDAKDNADDSRLKGTAEHEATTVINWYATDSVDVFAKAHFRSNVIGELGQNDVADSYTTIDLGMNYYFNNDLQLKFGVNNLTNTDVSDPITYTEVIRGTTAYAGLEYAF